MMKTFFLLASLFFLSVSAEGGSPEVHTALGGLRGGYVSIRGKESGVHTYLGIPFAKPPVGPALRLAPPQPVEAWGGVRDATQQPFMCIQHRQIVLDMFEKVGLKVDLPEVSEDCLYLNIYTPANRANNARLPVMVWIHGGGLAIGSASMFDPSALAAYQDVVVVLIQYRLGLLGFLSTGDEHLSGNFGLLDQVQALRWTQEHIHNFGGDPNSVTIFGESAGGVSVSLLLLSPLTKGLFHRAIAESGTAAMDALVANYPLSMTQVIANMSGCNIESTARIADCMKNVDIETLLPLTADERVRLTVNTDGHFLTKSVDELFSNHEILNIPFMTGVTNDEGGYTLPDLFLPKNWTEGLDLELVRGIFSLFFTDPTILDLVIEEYMGNGEDPVKNRNGYTELIGDTMFTLPAIKTANAHRDAGAPVYLYEYQYPPQFMKSKRPSFVKADHADDILPVLGLCFSTIHTPIQESCSKEEEEFSKIMMSYWGNFARTGSPNGEGLVHWPKYGADEKYLALDLKEQRVGQHLKNNRFILFTQTIPEKMQQQKEKVNHAPEVHTALGGLRGEYVSVKGKESGVHAYLGVPFAKPPVGPALRLAPPQPVEAWGGVRDATQQPFMCIQDKQSLLDLLEQLNLMANIPDVSEDCLYLNIYTPANRANNARLPVMVWIHGGGLAIGSASMFDGSALAAYQDVVVVLVQYRLGVLGFLSTGDEHLSGNFGLLDQVQALRWIQEHIHNFGGDPNSVTIFGESAGGVSASLMLLSPLTKGLVHRAIAESGTAAMDFLIANDPLPMTQVAANMSGCSIESTEKIADCMKNIDIETLLPFTADKRLRLTVSIDGHFLTKSVDELFSQNEILNIPLLTGVNNDEAGYLLTDYFAPKKWTEGLDLESIRGTLSVFFPDPTMLNLVIEEYMGNGEDPVKNRNRYMELIGDVMFTLPAIKCVNAHRDAGAPVYLYEYQYPPQFLQNKRPSFVKAEHGDEIFPVMGLCFTTKHAQIKGSCSKEEEEFSKIMMSYWGNFARTGSPNGEGLVHWPKYGAEEKYLALDLKEQRVGQHLKNNRFIFFTQTIPEKMQQQKEKAEHGEL